MRRLGLSVERGLYLLPETAKEITMGEDRSTVQGRRHDSLLCRMSRRRPLRITTYGMIRCR